MSSSDSVRRRLTGVAEVSVCRTKAIQVVNVLRLMRRVFGLMAEALENVGLSQGRTTIMSGKENGLSHHPSAVHTGARAGSAARTTPVHPVDRTLAGGYVGG